MFRNCSSHPRLEKTKFSETDFTISHYAGKVRYYRQILPLIITLFIIITFSYLQVTYQTDSFLEKNRDYIVAEHCNLLSSSRCLFVSGLFTSLPEESIRSSYKFSSVASRFKVGIKSWLPLVSFLHLKYALLLFVVSLIPVLIESCSSRFYSTRKHLSFAIEPNAEVLAFILQLWVFIFVLGLDCTCN